MANEILRYRQGIKSIESAGQPDPYRAQGPVTKSGDRAYGAYQVMGANIPEWTKAALGKSLTPEQFLADDKAQDAVFDHRFGSYVERFGNPLDAASAWFTGRPRSKGSAAARDVLGTSGAGYVNKFALAVNGGDPSLVGSEPGMQAEAPLFDEATLADLQSKVDAMQDGKFQQAQAVKKRRAAAQTSQIVEMEAPEAALEAPVEQTDPDEPTINEKVRAAVLAKRKNPRRGAVFAISRAGKA